MRNKWKIVSLATIPTISLFAIPTSISLIQNNNYKNISFAKNNLIDVPFKILNQGLSKDSVNVVIVGEGYTESDQEKFLKTVEYYVKYLFSFPQYKQLKQYINVYALKTPSNVDLSSTSMTPSIKDTYFESFIKQIKKGTPDFSYYGKKKFNLLKEQIKNNVAQNNNLSKTHIAMNTKDIRAASYGAYSVTGDLVRKSQNVFVHEMSHNFSLADEYTKNGIWPNISITNDPNTISWKNFLGFRNTGIKETKDIERGGILYVPSIDGDCIMKSIDANSLKFCEVCQYYSFKYIAENIKDGPMYISKPFISKSFDNATGYNQIVKEITNENDDLYEYENEKIDMRFIVDNPTDKDIKIKLKLEFTNKTDSSKSQTKEQIFTIKPTKIVRPEPEQIKITLDKPIEFKSSDHVYLYGYVYNADTNEMLVNTKSKPTSVGFEYEDQKQLKVNFLDISTNKPIDLINGPQEYNFYSEQDIKNIKPIELRGYKFNKKEKVTGGGNEWNWYYDKKQERKLTLNLYDSVDKKLVETKQRSLFEGETFEPQKSDFMFTKKTLNGVVKFKEEKINFDDTTNTIDYWLEYPEYRFKSIQQNSYQIQQGNDFNLRDKISIEVEQNEGSWVKNELFTEQMIIESNNFNNYVVGDYKIKYIFRNIHTEISVKVNANSSLPQDQKDIIQEMNKLISNPIQLNATGKQTNIINVNKNNIKQYVDNWPINQNAVIVELTELKTIVSTGNVEIKFKFKKGNTELFHTTNLGRFISDEYDVDQEIKSLVNFSFEIDYDKVKQTHISSVNDKNISLFIKNMPNSKNPNVKIEPYIQTRMDEIGQIALALKISKNSISKIVNGVWVSGFKYGKTDTIIPPIVDSDELDRKTLDNEIKKINNNPITINDLGKKTNIKNVDSNNISTYVNNWPKVDSKVTLKVENFRTNLKQGSVTFDLKLSLNNSSKSININVNGFTIDKDDENIVQPPVKPPIEPPTPPVDNNTQRPPIVENPEVNRPTTNEVLSTNQKLAPWKIGLIVGSSLLGVGLIVGSFFVVKKIAKRK